MTVEVNGTHGTLAFDYARLNELRYGSDGEDPQLYGMRTIRAEQASHPYAAHWWPIGQGVGYGASFVNQVAELLEHWPDGPWSPDFRHGAGAGDLRSDRTLGRREAMGQGRGIDRCSRRAMREIEKAKSSSVRRASNRSTPGQHPVLTPLRGITRLGGSKSSRRRRS